MGDADNADHGGHGGHEDHANHGPSDHTDLGDHDDVAKQSFNVTHTSADDHIQYICSRIVDLIWYGWFDW